MNNCLRAYFIKYLTLVSLSFCVYPIFIVLLIFDATKQILHYGMAVQTRS